METNEPLISVIVPIYNVENYLRPCLDSIINQTHRNLQILLIDDGSTDKSGDICDDYCKRDKRCQVIHQKNAWISGARNTGLKYATGDFIAFVDGDDIIHPQMYETLLYHLLSGDYSFSTVSYTKIFDNAQVSWGRVNPTGIKTAVLSKNDLMPGVFFERMIGIYKQADFAVVWNKLYKREALQGLYFLKTGAEDVEFNCKVYLHTEKAIYINAEMYGWVQRNSSITHQSVNASSIDYANSYLLCLSYIPKNETYYRAFCLERIYKVMVNKRYYAAHTKDEQLALQTVSSIKEKTIGEFIKNKQIPPIKKTGLLIFVFLPAVYSGFMWLCEKRAQINSSRHR